MKLIIKDNVYEVTKKATDLIIAQCKGYAKPGTIYAARKGDTVSRLNEKSGVREYKKNGFEVLRKEGTA